MHGTLSLRKSLYRVDQRSHSLNPDLETVAGLNGSHSAGCPREDHVTRKECHVGRNEAHQMEAVEDHLAGVAVLAQLTVLEELDAQVMRIDLGLDVRPQRRERVEGLRPRKLAFAGLDRPVGDVLGSRVTKDVTSGRGRSDIAHLAPDDYGELGLEIVAMVGKGNLDLGAVGDERGRSLEPEEWFLGQRHPGLPSMIGIIQTYRDNLRRLDRGQRLDTLERSRFFLEGWRAKDITLKLENLPVDDLGVEDILTLLEPADGCHR